jgi:preflagellin peptidase FlaK
MESIVDGKHITHVRPRNQENQSSDIDLLVKAGHRRVWVTPKIPFIVPILASLILTVAVGNLLLLIFPL